MLKVLKVYWIVTDWQSHIHWCQNNELQKYWIVLPPAMENLEYSGISLNMENSWNSVQPQGKIVTNMNIFVIKYLRKTAVVWVNRIIRISGSSDPA